MKVCGLLAADWDMLLRENWVFHVEH